jgi:hypothetical protein
MDNSLLGQWSSNHETDTELSNQTEDIEDAIYFDESLEGIVTNVVNHISQQI